MLSVTSLLSITPSPSVSSSTLVTVTVKVLVLVFPAASVAVIITMYVLFVSMSEGFSKSGADLKTISPVIGSIVNLLESFPLIDHRTSSSAEYDVTAVVFSGIDIVATPVIVGATVSLVSLSNI